MPTGTVWASSVIAYSTQYSTANWAATQALGAPNTYASYGDIVTAWATATTDAAGEYIQVGYSPAPTGSAVYIVGTYNPDAVWKVTVSTATGDTVTYTNASPVSVGGCSYVLIVPTQTTSPITKVRVDLKSENVAGWNEIDAIGIAPLW
jgi:hypothetical protein